MGFEELAASAVKKISIRSGKKLLKQMGAAPEIPKAQPVTLRNTAQDKYSVGFAMRETMPADVTAKQYWMAGFKSGNLVTGVSDPMTVRAMWIGFESGGIVMVSADCIGLSGYEVKLVRDSLKPFAEKTGCVSINISCTHTHAGIDTLGYWGKPIAGPIPGNGKDPEFVRMFLSSIRDVCVEAYEKRTEGKLFIGTAHVPDAQFDGREPMVYHDTLTRIRFVPDDGTTETWFLNFGAHPNTLGGQNTSVSADYPYYLREAINKKQATNVLFSVNAIAAMDAGHYSEDRKERTVLQGEALAAAALAIDNDEQMKAEITVLRQPYYSPIDNGVLTLMGLIKTVNSLKYPCDKGELGIALLTEMTYIKLGTQQMLMIPGEAMPEFVYGGYSSKETSATGEGPEINPRPLVEVANDENLLVFGVTNDMTGYMVPPNDFVLHDTQAYLNGAKDRNGNKHYHETNSLGYLTTQTISDVFAGMMSSVG